MLEPEVNNVPNCKVHIDTNDQFQTDPEVTNLFGHVIISMGIPRMHNEFRLFIAHQHESAGEHYVYLT